MNKLSLILGGVFCAFAVMLGAFAAHGLKASLAPQMLAAFQTGVDYQFIHGLALIVFGTLGFNGFKLKWASIFAVLGVVLFSGSLYLLALTSNKFLGPITPVGGISFIVSWVLFTVAVITHKPTQINK
jgi:uncharacterized membrane protein YgdD (TMEM256/DUF423 family)